MTPELVLGLVFLGTTLAAAAAAWPGSGSARAGPPGPPRSGPPAGDPLRLLRRDAGPMPTEPASGPEQRALPGTLAAGAGGLLSRLFRRGDGRGRPAAGRTHRGRRGRAAHRGRSGDRGDGAFGLERPGPRRLAERLRRADWLLQPHEFVALTMAAGVAGALLGLALGRGLGLVFLGALAGVWAPHALLDARAHARQRTFETQLPDALDIIANALRAGTSFLQAMDVVARELPPPVGREFELVVRECRVDIPLEEALSNLVERVPSADLDLAVTAVLIQRQVGGNLAEVLDIINHTIRERMRIQGEVRTLTAQGRLSGLIVGLLPVGLGLVLYLFSPQYILPLLTTGVGRMLLALGVGMQLIGIAVIKKLVRLEV